jgi:hypothetical protein
MILGKFWGAIRGQLNKIANIFWEADPIAQMQYEHDLAVEQLKEGRKGLEVCGLVERVTRQASTRLLNRSGLSEAGDRETAAKLLSAAESQKELAQHEEQLDARDPVREQPEEDETRQPKAGRSASVYRSMMPS